MFCKFCGFRLPDNANFCPNCGARVNNASVFSSESYYRSLISFEYDGLSELCSPCSERVDELVYVTRDGKKGLINLSNDSTVFDICYSEIKFLNPSCDYVPIYYFALRVRDKYALACYKDRDLTILTDYIFDDIGRVIHSKDRKSSNVIMFLKYPCNPCPYMSAHQEYISRWNIYKGDPFSLTRYTREPSFLNSLWCRVIFDEDVDLIKYVRDRYPDWKLEYYL